MATATRSLIDDLEESPQDAPQGSVPAPFPTFILPGGPEQIARPSNQSSTQHQALDRPTEPKIIEDDPSLLQDSVSELQHLSLSIFATILASSFLNGNEYEDAFREAIDIHHSSTSTPTYDIPTYLQILLTNIDPLQRPLQVEMQSKSKATELLTKFSLALSSLTNRGRLATRDHELANALLPFILTANKFRGSEASTTDKLPPLLTEEDISGNLERLKLSLSLLQGPLRSKPEAASGALLEADGKLVEAIVTRQTSNTTSRPRSILPPNDFEFPPLYFDHNDTFPAHQTHHIHDLPAYENLESESSSDLSAYESKVRHVQSAPDLGRVYGGVSNDEKMQFELDVISMAIERSNSKAPQLHDQRVELKASKRQELELAKIEGGIHKLGDRIDGQRSSRFPFLRSRTASNNMLESISTPGLLESSRDKGKGKSREVTQSDQNDIDDLFDKIDLASNRVLYDQQYFVPDEAERLKRYAEREAAKKNALVDRLKKNVEAGRLHSQDATFTVRSRKPSSNLLNNSTFEPPTRSPPSTASSGSTDAHDGSEDTTQTSISSRVSQAPKTGVFAGAVLKTKRSFSRTRPRSLSAPLLDGSDGKKASKKVSDSVGLLPYVAEYQENLAIVSCLVTLPEGYTSELTPLISFSNNKSGISSTSLDLQFAPPSESQDYDTPPSPPMIHYSIVLPVSVDTSRTPTPQVIQGRLELKMKAASRPEPDDETSPIAALMSANQLSVLQPTNFICTSCSLPLIHLPSAFPLVDFSEGSGSSSKQSETKMDAFSFTDLPSEFWGELVEAWMCHSDQKLNKDVVAKANNSRLRPKAANHVLVGGSYLIVDKEAVNTSSIVRESLATTRETDTDCYRIHCLCGSVLGARQTQPGDSVPVYRLNKHAIRPTGGSFQFERPPPSAYVVADMHEIAYAHATHRFVIHDEEDEKIRMLIWLFKPSMQLSYAQPKATSMPHTGVPKAAKVMFKLVGPKETIVPDQLPRLHPDFAGADHLYYPLHLCITLAHQLRESNRAYPESSRTMGPLSWGWLRRE